MENAPTYSLKDLIIYFLKLGTWGFGGPVALVGYMHRDLVEEKKWISDEDYKEGLALSQLAPGPLAAQLSIYIGYVHYRILGATLVGLAFVIPSFLMVLGIGYAYVSYGGLPWMQVHRGLHAYPRDRSRGSQSSLPAVGRFPRIDSHEPAHTHRSR